MRLDEERLEALRSWGERLGESASEEYAAIGRAILMLVAEIDRLHIDLWHARMARSEREPVATAEAEEGEPIASSLHTRLQRALRRSRPVQPTEHSGPDTES